MCHCLKISRQIYYYQAKEKKSEAELEEEVTKEFENSQKDYGARKIKAALQKTNIILSRRKIRKIMKKRGLQSNYTKSRYRHYVSEVNQSKVGNKLHRQFSKRMQNLSKKHFIVFLIH